MLLSIFRITSGPGCSNLVIVLFNLFFFQMQYLQNTAILCWKMSCKGSSSFVSRNIGTFNFMCPGRLNKFLTNNINVQRTLFITTLFVTKDFTVKSNLPL